jgi:HlyD family secretion protein
MKRCLLVLLLLLAGCSDREKQAWLGYAEGDVSFVAAPEAGWVSQVTVNRGDKVARGQRLFTLEDIHESAIRDEARAQIDQADAEIGQAKANLEFTQNDFERQSGLIRAHATTQQAYDLAKSNFDQAAEHVSQINAQKTQAEATLSDAAYQLQQRDVVSRTDGQVQDVFFHPGEYAPAMTPIISILPPSAVYVRFFVPETEFSSVKLGQRVSISCDGCRTNITARISFIASQEEFTPPVIYSIGNREKLVFKIEARAPGGIRLHPGEPVEVRALP